MPCTKVLRFGALMKYFWRTFDLGVFKVIGVGSKMDWISKTQLVHQGT